MSSHNQFNLTDYTLENGKLMSYAFPGGYPLYYVTNNAVLCPDCANAEKETIVAADVNCEDDSLYCEECNKQIESAFKP